jgi:hypothetical protein
VRFVRHVGIDYSGASTPQSSRRGLRVFLVEGGASPVEVSPPPSRRKYWSRRGLAEWLETLLSEPTPTIVGIDHGFSFPEAYFEAHQVEREWSAFLGDFHAHWPTDVASVQSLRAGNARAGSARWRRRCEEPTRAKSVFHFDVQGAVAKSTHAGLPWLKQLRERAGVRVHFWPFDGWAPPPGRSVVAEVYPSLWSAGFPREGRTPDQHDAYVVAARLRDADRDGTLERWFAGPEGPTDRTRATYEGWILGVKSSPNA